MEIKLTSNNQEGVQLNNTVSKDLSEGRESRIPGTIVFSH